MKQMRRASMAVGLLLLALMPVLTSCGTSAATSTSSPTATSATSATSATTATTASTAQAAPFRGGVAVGQSLTSLSQVGNNTTIGEVTATQQKIATQLNAVAARIPGENGPVLTRLETANNEITAAIANLPDTAT